LKIVFFGSKSRISTYKKDEKRLLPLNTSIETFFVTQEFSREKVITRIFYILWKKTLNVLIKKGLWMEYQYLA